MRRLHLLGAMLALGGPVTSASPDEVMRLKLTLAPQRQHVPEAPPAPVKPKGNVPGSVRRRLARAAKAERA